MERKVKAVCSVVGFLGLLCAVSGFAAEATRFKNGIPSSAGCTYPRTPAYGLGITAAVATMIAQIITSAASRCTCCCCSKGPHRSNPCWTVAIVCFVISWLGTVVAFLLLRGAAILNDSYIVTFGQDNSPSCPGVRSGVFAGATALSLASVMLGIIYYLILNSENKSVGPSTNQDGVAMGQPQFPPPQNAPDPVFVHEDTYMRRQALV